VQRWARALLAVLLGNLVYFTLRPRLPVSARHVPFRLDFGLLIDCCLCTVAFVLVTVFWRGRDG